MMSFPQKIRTVEQDGKTIKLQIVSFYSSIIKTCSHFLLEIYIFSHYSVYSGTLLDKNVSEQSPAATIVEPMALL